MKRIIVQTIKPVNNKPDVDFESMRQKEMEFIHQWKASGVLENFYIKSDKEGALLVFQNLEMAQVVKNIEDLPFFPYFEKVMYTEYDKIF